jgi:hypothetical protein
MGMGANAAAPSSFVLAVAEADWPRRQGQNCTRHNLRRAGRFGFFKTRSTPTPRAQRSRRRTDAGQALCKTWLRRRAGRFEPTTDVHLGMSFTAVVPGSGRIGGFRIPPVDSKIGVSTSNHEPAGGIRSHESTNLTSEFLQRCHSSVPYISWWSGPRPLAIVQRFVPRSLVFRAAAQLSACTQFPRSTKAAIFYRNLLHLPYITSGTSPNWVLSVSSPRRLKQFAVNDRNARSRKARP